MDPIKTGEYPKSLYELMGGDLIHACFVDGLTPYILTVSIPSIVDRLMQERTSGVVSWDTAETRYREEAVRDVVTILRMLRIAPEGRAHDEAREEGEPAETEAAHVGAARRVQQGGLAPASETP